jgi:hypothetical protein
MIICSARRFLAAILLCAVIAGAWPLARPAMATIGLTSTDPTWTFDELEIERQVATFAKNNSITTQTAWTAFINGLTSTQSTVVSQGILRSVKCSVP